ncbi:GntR family transcriptional regulator [Agromyces rhizosphaerae]|uniref:GntR family transcriptional regulator n=1 Tax=Agromyces rhizosphaerae TaxID=88374 RepID=A0A9W6CWZ5_9MICO|nr:GntR family transcriptional regulator [Agromyces rhizosphaerae]GLI26767.1 GntR family transcriptional regulator [Agromyces rhizosphaerae]
MTDYLTTRSHRRRASVVASESVYERLRDAILSGEIRPNMRLIEEDLAEALGVSRSPVREALLALTQDGLVVRDRGWVVRDHTPQEVLRIIEAREIIETEAAALAAARITEEELVELERLAEQMESSGADRPALNVLNREFHTKITHASGNFLLDEFSRRTNISYWNFSIGAMQPPSDDQVVNGQHREIIAALRAGDADAARERVREHLERTLEIMRELVGD